VNMAQICCDPKEHYSNTDLYKYDTKATKIVRLVFHFYKVSTLSSHFLPLNNAIPAGIAHNARYQYNQLYQTRISLSPAPLYLKDAKLQSQIGHFHSVSLASTVNRTPLRKQHWFVPKVSLIEKSDCTRS
jgi:hypothetical protein